MTYFDFFGLPRWYPDTVNTLAPTRPSGLLRRWSFTATGPIEPLRLGMASSVPMVSYLSSAPWLCWLVVVLRGRGRATS